MTVAEEERNGQMPENTILSVKNIVKTYPGVIAINHFSMEVREGEVHALIGENGAGKSTLIKTLSGAITPDEGTVCVNGKDFTAMTPKLAKEQGIEVIYQEFTLVPGISAAENVFLGEKTKPGLFVDIKEREKRARELFERLNVDIDVSKPVKDLSPAHQQLVEIAKAVSKQVKILIMDEPTAPLTVSEVETLFRIIKDLRSKGCGIVYISHRLEELQHIVDRVTIMRDGQYITSMNFKDTTMDQIIANMVGREIKEQFPRESCKKGEKILEVKGLNAGRMVRDINFALYEGEIVGFAGLMGAGRTETTRAIFGVDPKDSGEIILEGKTLKITNPNDAIRAGIVLAPEDRKKDGLCTKLSIRHNIALPNLDILCNKLGVVSSKKEDQMCDEAVENLKIKTPNVDINAGNLSGGNQQKVVVGKWLARNSKVVIFDEPTRGIDVAAKVEIYNLMNELKKQGIAVMFVSSEMPEVMGIADRIIVMCDGRITGELDARNTTQNEILTLATQFEKKIAANA